MHFIALVISLSTICAGQLTINSPGWYSISYKEKYIKFLLTNSMELHEFQELVLCIPRIKKGDEIDYYKDCKEGFDVFALFVEQELIDKTFILREDGYLFCNDNRNLYSLNNHFTRDSDKILLLEVKKLPANMELSLINAVEIESNISEKLHLGSTTTPMPNSTEFESNTTEALHSTEPYRETTEADSFEATDEPEPEVEDLPKPRNHTRLILGIVLTCGSLFIVLVALVVLVYCILVRNKNPSKHDHETPSEANPDPSNARIPASGSTKGSFFERVSSNSLFSKETIAITPASAKSTNEQADVIINV